MWREDDHQPLRLDNDAHNAGIDEVAVINPISELEVLANRLQDHGLNLGSWRPWY